jgi:flagellar biogenesis protein FliO
MFPPISPPTYRQDPAVTPASTDAPAPTAAAAAPAAEEKPAAALPIPAASVSAPPTSYSTSSEAAPTRRLAPRSTAAAKKDAAPNGPKKFSFPFQINSLQSFSTAGAGLAIVVGLFLICAWMLRRGGPKSNGALPPEAFAVLGRSPLTPQSIAHLLRIGNKLVLVAVSPDGAQPLTEVTDPIEVDRLTGLCSSGRGHGPAAEFQQVLAQLAKEPARGFLGAEATSGRRR